MRQINAAGRQLIREWEGYRIKAYLDGGGVPTICTGHTGGVRMGMIVTDEECERFFALDLRDHNIEPLLKGVPTTDNQYAAMTSLCFNIGLTGFAGSTVLKRHKLGNHTGAANAFLMWKYDNGKVIRGLINRREAERKLYLTPDAVAPSATPVKPPERPATPQAPDLAPMTPNESDEALRPPGCLAAILGMFRK